MRGLALLTTMLLLLSPLAIGQPGGGSDPGPGGDPSSSGNSTSDAPKPGSNGTGEPDGASGGRAECPADRPAGQRSAAERRACYCQANPDADACNGHASEEADRQAGPWRSWCRSEARDDARRERCRQALEEFGDEQGRHGRVTFDVDAANRTLLNYSIDGRVVLAAVALETGSDNLTVQRLGATLRIGDADSELVLHDNPSGLVRFKGGDGSVTVRLPDDAELAASSDGTVARVTFPDGTFGHLRASNATWIDDRTLLAAGFFAFLLPQAASDAEGGSASQPSVAPQVERAITERKVGAEIAVKAPARPAAVAAAMQEESTVDILAYDDVKVQVNVPSQAATPDAPIRVRVEAHLDEGRTIVLKLDRSVLESADPSSLVLRYYDLYAQADGSEVQTEVVFKQAASLEDVLDPLDDAGQPEYWVVEDANGLQVLVSVPHWSAHAVTIGSVLAAHPSVLAGILVGLAGSAVAAAAMLWPRRRDDE